MHALRFTYESVPDGGRGRYVGATADTKCRKRVRHAWHALVTRTTECTRVYSHTCIYKPLKIVHRLVVSLEILWRKKGRSFRALRASAWTFCTRRYALTAERHATSMRRTDSLAIFLSAILFDKNVGHPPQLWKLQSISFIPDIFIANIYVPRIILYS